MDDKELDEAVEQVLEESIETIDRDYEEALGNIREMVRSIYDGTADEDMRNEFKEALTELMVAWISLITGVFQSIGESPVSTAAIDFYTIMDTHRALLDMEPKSPALIEELSQQGFMGDAKEDGSAN